MFDGTDYSQQRSFLSAISRTPIREETRVVCYNQTVYDDPALELDEYAGLSLGVRDATGLTEVLPMFDQASILIQDNDSELYRESNFFLICSPCTS